MHEKEDVKFYENSVSLVFPWLRIHLPIHPPGDVGETPGWGTKILHATEQLSPGATTRGSETRDPT